MRRITIILLLSVVLLNYNNIFAANTSEIDSLVQNKIALIYQAIESGKVNAPIDDSYTPLQVAAMWATSPVVINDLVKAGADVHHQPEDSWSAVVMAAMDNPNPEVVKAFIAAGVDINSRDMSGTTLLSYAVSCGNDAIVGTLIELGADVNCRCPETGRTLLMETSSPEIFALLLKAGVDVKAQDSNGVNLLMRAAARKNVDAEELEAIVAAGADVNATDKEGRTALMYAADRIDFTAAKAVYALRALGARVDLRDKNGKTALDYARANDTLIGSHVYTLLREALTR